MSEPVEFNGFSIDDWREAFDKSTSETRRDAKKILRQGSKDIIDDSKLMAPVDTHNLENAHHLDDVTLNMDETEVTISVGGYVNGRDVDEYATIMHEGLAPFGSGTAGTVKPTIGNTGRPSLSYQKSISNPPDKQVGGKFLERAVDLHEEEIIEKITEAFLRDFNVD